MTNDKDTNGNGSPTVFTVKDWARMVNDQMEKMREVMNHCQTGISHIPELKEDVSKISIKLTHLSNTMIRMEEGAKIKARNTAIWVSLIGGGAAFGVIELLVRLFGG